MYGIHSTVYEKLMQYFEQDESIRQVILFGSRAQNSADFNSDIDLFIHYIGSDRGKVREEIDELIGVYSCDIVFQADQALQKQIDQSGITIYSKNES